MEHELKQVNVRLVPAPGLISKEEISNAETAVRLMADTMAGLDREEVCVLNLDAANHPICFNVVSIGAINASIVESNNVFKSAVLSNACSIILLHNHPSSSLVPSKSDVETTRKIMFASAVMDIPVLDHIIVGGGTGQILSLRDLYPGLFDRNQYLESLEKEISTTAGTAGNKEMPDWNVREEADYPAGKDTSMNEEKMTYEEFQESVKNHIREYLPEEYQNGRVEIVHNIKNNDIRLDGLIISKEDSRISPSIYLNDFYEKYEIGVGMENVMQSIASMRTDAEAEIKSQDALVGLTVDYEAAEPRMFCRLVNRENNRQYLEDKPYTPMQDLAVTYHVLVDSFDQDGICSFPVTNQMLKAYGVDVDTLEANAIPNTKKLFPPKLQKMEDVMRGMMEKMDFDMCMEQDLFAGEGPDVFILTNDTGINGAAAILYPDVQKNISDFLEGDYYVLPSSVHEVLILEDLPGTDYRDLEGMVREVNSSAVQPQERLSDHVYHFDRNTGELVQCGLKKEVYLICDPQKQEELEERFLQQTYGVTLCASPEEADSIIAVDAKNLPQKEQDRIRELREQGLTVLEDDTQFSHNVLKDKILERDVRVKKPNKDRGMER